MAKILVVDDDELLVGMVKDYLDEQYFTVETAVDGRLAEQLMETYEYDVIVLDWDLPGVSGLEILKGLRAQGKMTPVMMLTGKDQVDDKELGLNAGADDYLTKPFHMKELLARVRALLRRQHAVFSSNLSYGPIDLDPQKREVRVGGEEVSLLPKEFSLLEFFLRHPEQVFSADALIDRVWKAEEAVGHETVRQCIKRLRKKIDSGHGDSLIETVYGVGYKLRQV